jgi:hypothetical protein
LVSPGTHSHVLELNRRLVIINPAGVPRIDARERRRRSTTKEVTLSPLAFGAFGGRYEGSVHLTLAEATRLRWQGNGRRNRPCDDGNRAAGKGQALQRALDEGRDGPF